MNAQQNKIEFRVSEDIVVFRVDKKNSKAWEDAKTARPNRGEIDTFAIEAPKSIRYFFKVPEHIKVGSSVHAADGVSVLGNGSTMMTTGTSGYEVANSASISEMPEWLLIAYNNPLGVFTPNQNGIYTENVFVDISDNIIMLPRTSEVKVVSEEDFQGFLSNGDGSLSDLGNCQRLVKLYGDTLRWNKSFDWVEWDGKKWLLNSPYAKSYAKRISQSIYVEASRITNNSDMSKAWAKWAHTSCSDSKINDMLELAKSDLFAETKAFDDNHHMLLNVQNGILNLETGELIPHDHRYNMTKIANVYYDPDAKCPEWEKFLEMVLPDEDVRAFAQRAWGITLSGNSDARSIFFLHNGSGTGNNGKSTMVSVMLEMLGEYAKQTDVSILSASRGGITPYNEDLYNRRFVCTNEIDKDFKLSTTTVKNLTGNDRVSCNPKFRQSYDFPPTHTLWVFGNNRPNPVGGGDEAFWGRVKLIPFEVEIPKEIRKPMEQVLPMFRKEFSGILNWAIEGLQMYVKEGLKEPEQVKIATQAYQEEYNFFTQFLEEECVLDDYKTPKKMLFHAYNDFLRENSATDQEISKKAFAQKLAKVGVTVGGDGKGFYIGIRLVKEEQIKRKLDTEQYVNQRFTPPIGK